MAPPGRRRSSMSIISVILCSLLFFSHTVSAISAVLGVDIGTEYIKAALVKPGIPLEIVLSKDSKRKEASAVAFKPLRGAKATENNYPERSYGGDALALAARFPHDVYPNLKQLLGLPVDWSSPVVKDYAARYPALEVVKSETRGTAAFKSKSFDRESKPFSVEELLAMQLLNVKENAQSLAGKAHTVKSVVFTIPPFYTVEEKSALELAAELAGLKVLGVVSDGLAVGINYATSRTFELVNEGGKPEHHMIFDVGAGSTTATVLKFQGRSVKDVGKFNKTIQEVSVLGTGWDRTLGGDSLNALLVEDMATKFLETSAAKKLGKSIKDVLSEGRTASKLWKDAERLRQVLSANSQTASSFEELYQEVDFKYKLSRAEFETQTESWAERLDAPFKAALKAANLSATDLDSVILHGGATRTPFIQKRLETLVGEASKLRSNVNADEAAVFGAAFKAASISPSFRVKEIRASDAAIYATWIQYPKEKGGKTQQQKIFTPSSFIGSTKFLTLPKLEDFELYLYQNRPTDNGAPLSSTQEGKVGTKYATKNLTASVNKLAEDTGCKKEAISTKFHIRLDPVFGLPEVVSGSVSCEHEVIDKKGVVDGVKDLFGFGKKADDSQKVLKDEDTSSSSATGSSSSSGAKSSETAAKGKKASKKEDTKPAAPKMKTSVIKIELETTHDPSTVISWVEKRFIEERIKAFDASDKARRSREEDLNNLEAFTYKSRDLISDESFTAFASQEQIAAIEALFKTTSEWLSEEGYSAAPDILKSKLKDLKALVDPIRKRKDESVKRPEMTKLLQDALRQAQGLMDIIKDSIEQSSSSSSAAAAFASASASAAEEASKEAASAASASSATATSAGTESSADPLAELEEDEPASSSGGSSTTEAPKASPSPDSFMAPYTDADLKELTDAYEVINTWLAAKLAEQEKLKPYEEPVFVAGELEKKATELNEALMRLFNRKMKSLKSTPTSTKSKASKPTKKPKTKTAKGEDKVKSVKDKISEKVKSATDKVAEEATAAFEIKDEGPKTKDEL